MSSGIVYKGIRLIRMLVVGGTVIITLFEVTGDHS
jgi:hypothetical protein